jgi:hypothetical protein
MQGFRLTRRQLVAAGVGRPLVAIGGVVLAQRLLPWWRHELASPAWLHPHAHARPAALGPERGRGDHRAAHGVPARSAVVVNVGGQGAPTAGLGGGGDEPERCRTALLDEVVGLPDL